MINSRWQQLRERIAGFDEGHGGVLGIALGAARSFTRAEGGEAAAGLAFYAIFSLFPLLAVAVSLTSLLAGPETISGLLLSIIGPAFPLSYNVIQEAIQRFSQQHGAFGLVGAVSLLWAASGAFAILVKHINAAFENARIRNFLQGRLMALGLVGIILVLLIVVLLASLLLGVFVQMRAPIMPLLPLLISPLRPLLLWLLGALPFLITFFAFLFMYRFLPSIHVRYRDAFWGALVTSAVWIISSTIFSGYMRYSVPRYSLLYGPVAALAVLMIWIYLSNVMILFGAHISAAVARRRIKKATPEVTIKES